ncbi:MAG: CHAD domain-containing protein [Thermoleophilaceae bacterium]
MAKPREIEGIECGTPFREAAVRAVEVRADELFSFAGGVLDTTDIERVHDMRVATRRLRAAMEVFAPCFPRKRHRKALRDVKALADALGARRDPDVHLEALASYARELPGTDLSGIEAKLAARQAEGNAELKEALADVDRLRKRLKRLTEAARA